MYDFHRNCFLLKFSETKPNTVYCLNGFRQNFSFGQNFFCLNIKVRRIKFDYTLCVVLKT